MKLMPLNVGKLFDHLIRTKLATLGKPNVDSAVDVAAATNK